MSLEEMYFDLDNASREIDREIAALRAIGTRSFVALLHYRPGYPPTLFNLLLARMDSTWARMYAYSTSYVYGDAE